MVALGVGATIMAVPRALSGIVAVPQEAEPGISRAVAPTPSAKPSTAKMPVWSAPATKSASAADITAPTAVTGLHLVANTESSITIAWDPARDNVAVRLYVVKGDGFGSVQTTGTKASVPWAHRTAAVTLRVSAVDTSGNQSDWRSLVVPRPTMGAGTTAASSAPATTATLVTTTSAPATPTTTTPAPTPSGVPGSPGVGQSSSVTPSAVTLSASAPASQSA